MTEFINDRAEAQIVGAEVVPPVTDAVRFVHNEQRRAGFSQMLQHLFALQLLRSKEDELQLALLEVVEGFILRRFSDHGIDDSGAAGIPLIQFIDLIALQCDEWGDDDRRARYEDSGYLINGRDAVAGREYGQRVLAF